jgi:hypothetical protein
MSGGGQSGTSPGPWINTLTPTGLQEGLMGMLTGQAYEQTSKPQAAKRGQVPPRGPSALTFMQTPQPQAAGSAMSLQDLLRTMRGY